MNNKNLSVEYWRHLHHADVKLCRVNDFVWLASKTKDPFFNALIELPTSQDYTHGDEEIIDRFFNFGVENDVKQNVWIEESDVDFYKSKMTHLKELTRVSTLCLTNFKDDVVSNHEGISVHQVKSIEDLKRWFFVFKESFSLSNEGARLFFNVFLESLNNKKFQYFYMEENKTIVSILTLMDNDRFRSLYNFATSDKYRRKGYIGYLIKRVLSEVCDHSMVYVQANPSSVGLLKNIGFVEEKTHVIFNRGN